MTLFCPPPLFSKNFRFKKDHQIIRSSDHQMNISYGHTWEIFISPLIKGFSAKKKTKKLQQPVLATVSLIKSIKTCNYVI